MRFIKIEVKDELGNVTGDCRLLKESIIGVQRNEATVAVVVKQHEQPWIFKVNNRAMAKLLVSQIMDEIDPTTNNDNPT